MEYPKFKVCCRCFTFNQAKYITDAMNGFTIQQTSFPFVCTIVDDASTDGEQEVIKQYVDENFDWSEKGVSYTKETDYAHILYAQHKTNKNCYFAVLFLKENHYSIKKPKLPYLKEWDDEVEFIAMCEGDDFWTDILKLQKQFDALEEYPQATMCYTGFMCVTEDGLLYQREAYKKLMEKSFSGDNFIALLKGPNYPMTLTCMVRKNVFESPFYHEAIVRYDYGLFLTAASIGDFIFLPDRTACYRNSSNGLMNTQKNNLIESSVQTKLFFADCVISNKTKHVCFLGKIRVLLSIVDNHLSMRKTVSNKYYVAFLKRHKMLSLLYPVVLLKKCIMHNVNKV